ncbi:MAG: hypothetical protein N2646_06345 [Bellilinea sp.]|nr:hypothetical protein [Bellilinea sp.]
MKETKSNPLRRLESLTSRWWFFLIIILLSFMPLYSQRPYDPRNTSLVINAVLSQPLIYSLPAVFPLFKLLALGLTIWLLVQPQKAQRWFSLYAGLNLLGIAVFQNSAVTGSYGLVIITGNVILFGVIGIVWLVETIKPRSNFSARPLPLRAWFILPLMLFAFWMPIQVDSMLLNPDPRLFFLNEAGLTGCMMLPVYTGLLVIFYPNVNRVLLRLSGFIGLLIALFNLLTHFIMIPANFWMGVLHLPLFFISLIAFVLSLRKPTAQTT